MRESELRALLETTTGYETFLIKATKYHEGLNANRKKREKWDDAKIERTTLNMWNSMIEKLYSQLDEAITCTRYNREEKWQKFFEENAVVEGFVENMSELEFD